MSEVNTLLIGRNRLFLEGLKSLLRGSSFNVCGEALCVGAIEETDAPAGLVLIELRDDLSGVVEDLHQLREDLPETPVVVLTDERDPRTLASCLNAGAAAFLLKDISLEALIHSLKLALLGQKVMPTDLAAALINGAAGLQPVGGKGVESYGLSDRELEILRCLVNGDANKVIANRLDITEATVKVHMKSLLRKIKAGNRTQAAIWALNHGLAPGLPFGKTDRAAVAAPAAKEVVMSQMMG
ncbi:response regulator transcription factor [Pelagibius sp. CAU 1746]|uniref:response regulator transcription factor n=1 Tax=Pelagibius sp. CAU 1746 TaxID=3140370 RepID=UPI00325A8316